MTNSTNNFLGLRNGDSFNCMKDLIHKVHAGCHMMLVSSLRDKTIYKEELTPSKLYTDPIKLSTTRIATNLRCESIRLAFKDNFRGSHSYILILSIILAINTATSITILTRGKALTIPANLQTSAHAKHMKLEQCIEATLSKNPLELVFLQMIIQVILLTISHILIARNDIVVSEPYDYRCFPLILET